VEAPTGDALKAYEGTYFSEELNTTFRLSLEDGVLTIFREGGRTARLRALANHTFTNGDLTIRFTPGAALNTGFELNIGRVRGLKFVRTGG
jgi:hypothetical protein